MTQAFAQQNVCAALQMFIKKIDLKTVNYRLKKKKAGK